MRKECPALQCAQDTDAASANEATLRCAACLHEFQAHQVELERQNEALRQSEQEARELARELIDLYQNAPCGYHWLDAEGRIVRINDTELAWLGNVREELLGRPLADLLTPASRRLFLANLPLLQQRGIAQDFNFDMLRKDGTVLPVLLNSAAIFDASDRFVMSRAKVSDMTEQKNHTEERTRQEARRVEISHRLIEVEEKERRRLALAVHDIVSPNLAAVLLNLGIIEAGMSREVAKGLGPSLSDVRQLIRETNDSLRDICANLRPSVLDYAGLYAAVDNYARQFAARTGVLVKLRGGDAEGRLPAEVETLLFRIVQEALTNCAKYAQARNVSIQLTHDQTHACLEIVDDGVGFDAQAAGGRQGLGLLTMAERAEFARGQFRLESQPGQGTRISVEI